MARSSANITTENASRYLQQLCKHWGHRFTVTFDPNSGNVDFGNGQALDLSASQQILTLTVSDAAKDQITDLEAVVTEHLRRFAFREDLDVKWEAFP